MVKGVERTVVEIRDTGSGCFERALFFVRAQPPAPGSDTMAEEAARIVARYELARRGGWQTVARLRARLRCLGWAAGGAGAVGLLWVLSARL